jgi:phytoene dehydrogenase-like protein
MTFYSRSISYSRCVSSSRRYLHTSYDAIVIGGGHNGLVAASYLAKAGKRVGVFEKRHLVGGAAVTEEIVPGFKFSRASYVYSLFRPEIVKDLNLHKYGLTLLQRIPSSFTPHPKKGGKSLILGGSLEEDVTEISKFSKKDAEAYPKYNELLERYSAALRPLLDISPPDPSLVMSSPFSFDYADNLKDSIKTASYLGGLGSELPGFFEFLTSPATKILDRWFESEELKATLATDAIIGAMISPSTPGSAYVLLHHVMCGTWMNVKGGMGALSDSIAASAKDFGAEIYTNSNVKHIITTDGSSTLGGREGAQPSKQACGIEVEIDGKVRTIKAPFVLSCAPPSTTFLRLLGEKDLPEDFVRQIETFNVSTGSVKINLALSRLPNFNCKPNEGGNAMPHHRGTIHFETHTSQIETAFNDAAFGNRPSSRPVIEMTIPTVLDPALAPPGKHVALLFCQYAPYSLNGVDGGWDASGQREKFAQSVYSVIEDYAPGFTASIEGSDILTPVDLERVFGLPGGNIFHGAMGLDQLFFNRPAPHFARYRTPVKGLYLCGAGAHPGGGVMGAAGRNSARTCLSDMV